ncbi:MAG: hypothetical protein LC687_02605 [Actinobacteria bacterium]|nr:hypothetical protein [Actinomycetota bacterium]MCA1806743.1 hypothetical protein [Actinomycetota bacterium]
MTLPQYLDTLAIGGQALVWGKSKISQQQLNQAGGFPYVLLVQGGVNKYRTLHQGLILAQTLTLSIYQEPTTVDTLPSASDMQALWHSLFLAPEYVDEGTYGRSIIKLEYEGGFAPDMSERSSGLVAAVRFRELFGYTLTEAVGG